ncbi:MAG: transposase [Elusimicrobia bacterium]|nr:transposase [Elusimicrobiota bacterium]
MARIARIVVPGIPHHIIQRGNRRQNVFFSMDDKKAYLDYLINFAKPAGIQFWGYCLMSNHVHLIAVPERKDSLGIGLGEAHKRYTRMINFRNGWRGFLWEGRFKSYPMHEKHLYSTLRYIERNPVRAGIVTKAEDYPWSSARAHIYKFCDKLISSNFAVSSIGNWRKFLQGDVAEEEKALIIQHLQTGRPHGDNQFIEQLSKTLGRDLSIKKTGPKTK